MQKNKKAALPYRNNQLRNMESTSIFRSFSIWHVSGTHDDPFYDFLSSLPIFSSALQLWLIGIGLLLFSRMLNIYLHGSKSFSTVGPLYCALLLWFVKSMIFSLLANLVFGSSMHCFMHYVRNSILHCRTLLSCLGRSMKCHT